jgi:hypothetical protein
MPYSRNIALEFEGPFPKLPTKLMVYRVKEANVTEEFVRKFGEEHFGIERTAKIKHSSPSSLFWLKGEKWVLSVRPETGSLVLQDSLFFGGRNNFEKIKQLHKEKGTDYPSGEQCRIIAEQFLTDHNLLPQDAYFRGVVDNRASVVGHMGVGYGRNINGYKSWGAGAKIGVGIWPDGQVVKVHKTWQELVPYKVYPLKPPEQALQELRERKGLLFNGNKGSVQNITLRYYTEPSRQKYVAPVYYFECKGAKPNFFGLVPAISDEYLKSKEETRGKRDARKKRLPSTDG